MPYATNQPRVARPRGLGEVAERAGDESGAWVIDRPWGLRPAYTEGHGSPYGPDVVKTRFPRSDLPRLLNVSNMVVPRPTWPTLRPANSPVFRTPVARPGARVNSIPGRWIGPTSIQHRGNYPIERQLSGFGRIPMGVARPPFELLRGAEPGFGQEGAESITVAGVTISLSDEDLAWIEQNQAKLKQTFLDLAETYVLRRRQLDLWREVVDNAVVFGGHENAVTYADTKYFGGTAARQQAESELSLLERTRIEVQNSVSGPELETMPPALRTVYATFIEGVRSSPAGAAQMRGFGELITMAAVLVIVKVVAIFGGLALGGYAIYKGIGYFFSPTAEKANIAVAQARMAQAQVDMAKAGVRRQIVNAWSAQLAATTDPAARQRLMDSMAAMQSSWALEDRKTQEDLANVSSGRGFVPLVVGLAALAGIVALGWFSRGRPEAKVAAAGGAEPVVLARQTATAGLPHGAW
jgi:hypothetical protein